MASSGDFAFSRSTVVRWPTMLLLASIAVIAAAMVEASRTVRSQDEIVANTAREYANIAVWGYAQRLTAEMENAVREPLGPVNHGNGLHEGVQYPDVRELPHMIRWSNSCQCHQTRFGPSPMIFWGFVLNSDTLRTAGSPL